MFSIIASLLKAIASALGIAEKRQEILNTPEMQANAKAAQDENIKKDTREAIAERDLEKIRKLAAE